MLDGMISAMASNFAYFLGGGGVPGPLGTGFATIVPYACFPTADRPVAIAVASEKLWLSFCRAVERPEWLTDARLGTNPLRVKHRAWFEPELSRVLQQRPSSEWVERFAAEGIPCSPVLDMAEVRALPQAAARELFPVVEHPKAGRVAVTGLPVKMADVGEWPERAAPLKGQHTEEALRELLGLGEAELAALARERVTLQA